MLRVVDIPAKNKNLKKLRSYAPDKHFTILIEFKKKYFYMCNFMASHKIYIY